MNYDQKLPGREWREKCSGHRVQNVCERKPGRGQSLFGAESEEGQCGGGLVRMEHGERSEVSLDV